MPRIRTVKPQYWSTPDPPSRDARLLYIAMWNWADDEGIGTANPKELAAFAFPYDDDLGTGEVRELLREVSRSFHCLFYEVGGRPYYAIENFREHQVINKPKPSTKPKPEKAEKWLYQQECNGVGLVPESYGTSTGPEHREHRGTLEHREGSSVTSGGAGGGELELVDAELIPLPESREKAKPTYLAEDWQPSPHVRDELKAKYPNLKLGLILEEFVNYWTSLPKTARNRRTDWDKTFRNRVSEVSLQARFQRTNGVRPGADAKAVEWEQLKERYQ